MNPPYVTMNFSPEEALEVAEALKASKENKAQRIVKPLSPPTVTIQMLLDACKAAGIKEASLVRGVVRPR